MLILAVFPASLFTARKCLIAKENIAYQVDTCSAHWTFGTNLKSGCDFEVLTLEYYSSACAWGQGIITFVCNAQMISQGFSKARRLFHVTIAQTSIPLEKVKSFNFYFLSLVYFCIFLSHRVTQFRPSPCMTALSENCK